LGGFFMDPFWARVRTLVGSKNFAPSKV